MSAVSDRQLLALILDGLEPGVTEALSERVEQSASLSRRVQRLRAQVADPTPTEQGPSWMLPPPQLRLPGAPTLQQGPQATFGEVYPGGRFTMLIGDRADADRLKLLVLHEGEQGWEVISPRAPEDQFRLAELQFDGEQRRLDVAAAHRCGRQRWAVVILPEDYPIDWTLSEGQRWVSVSTDIQDGRLQSSTIDIDVSAPSL